MPTRPAEPRSGCPINAAVEVIGDRWSLLVLRDVMFGNRRHFRVLQERSLVRARHGPGRIMNGSVRTALSGA